MSEDTYKREPKSPLSFLITSSKKQEYKTEPKNDSTIPKTNIKDTKEEKPILKETISRINKLISSNKFTDADIAIRQALLYYPDSLEVKNLQGVLKMITNKNEEAKEIFLGIINKDPENITACNNLAMIFWINGDIENASNHFDKALNLSKYDKSIVKSYCDMLISNKKYLKAKGILEEFLNINPDDEEIKSLLNKCHLVLDKANKLSSTFKPSQKP